MTDREKEIAENIRLWEEYLKETHWNNYWKTQDEIIKKFAQIMRERDTKSGHRE